MPPAWFESYERPVLSRDGDLVLLSGGWDQYAHEEDGSVLVALDSATGAVRFDHRVPQLRPGMSECQVGLPAVAPDGRIAVAVYQWDVSMVVHWLDEHGTLLREDDLGALRESALHLKECDSGIKLWLQPLVVAGDSYLTSWVYRVRSYHLECRSANDGAFRWETDARLCAVSGSVAIVETDPPRNPERRLEGARIAGHALANGKERWTLGPIRLRNNVRQRSPLGLAGDAFLTIDRTARADAFLAREAGIVELAMATDIEDFEELERRWDAGHPEPGDDLVSLDTATGAERWRRPLRGAARSVAGARDAVCAVVAPLNGGTGATDASAELCSFDANGAVIATHPLAMQDPVVVATDGTLVLVATKHALVAMPLDAPERELWRVDLPFDIRAESAAVGDRNLDETTATLAGDRIYMRKSSRLCCLGA